MPTQEEVTEVAKKKKVKLEIELYEAEASYAAAWGAYGSELGPDDTSRSLRKKIAILDDVLNGTLGLTPEDDHEDAEDIKVLEELAEGVREELATMRERIQRRVTACMLLAENDA